MANRQKRLDASFTRHVDPNRFSSFAEFSKGVLRANYASFYEDFLPASGATLPAPWATQDTSAAGAPTLAYVDDARNGVFRLAFAADNEVENLTLYFGDQLCIPATQGWIFECALNINPAGATLVAATDKLVWGMASTRTSATLDDHVSNCWFRTQGANLDILTESDDGTTDTDDVDTGVNYTDNAFHRYLIDATDVTQILFYINLNDGNGWDLVASHSAAAWAVTNRLQPYIEFQRSTAGTSLDVVDIDYVACAWAR